MLTVDYTMLSIALLPSHSNMADSKLKFVQVPGIFLLLSSITNYIFMGNNISRPHKLIDS